MQPASQARFHRVRCRLGRARLGWFDLGWFGRGGGSSHDRMLPGAIFGTSGFSSVAKGIAVSLWRAGHDAGWATFVTMLAYKAARYGRDFTKVGRAFPSSQLCSACGRRDGPKPLHIRTWTCRACGTRHDRDHNAAQNVKYEGRRIRAA
jgi:ribosomal protein L37AE/L43A